MTSNTEASAHNSRFPCGNIGGIFSAESRRKTNRVSCAFRASLSAHKLPGNNRGVVSAEPERVVHNRVNRQLARRVWHVIEVTLRVRLFEIDGRRDDIGLDGLDAD